MATRQTGERVSELAFARECLDGLAGRCARAEAERDEMLRTLFRIKALTEDPRPYHMYVLAELKSVLHLLWHPATHGFAMCDDEGCSHESHYKAVASTAKPLRPSK